MYTNTACKNKNLEKNWRFRDVKYMHRSKSNSIKQEHALAQEARRIQAHAESQTPDTRVTAFGIRMTTQHARAAHTPQRLAHTLHTAPADPRPHTSCHTTYPTVVASSSPARPRELFGAKPHGTLNGQFGASPQ